ncbi:MAG: peptidylprolyl isomerase [Xenococcaceae cyanobacterium]
MVNFLGISIEPAEIVDFLKREMLLKEICQKILYQKIIEQAATERNIEISPEEIETEANSIRYGKRLEKAADTLAWLEEQMVTTEEWEAGIRTRLLAKKLASNLFDTEVESYFAQNRLDFDRFVLYQIVVPYQQLAQEIYYQIEEEEISFYEAAHLYDIDEGRRYRCGYEGKIGRWSLPPHLAEAIGNASVGNVIGPIASEEEQKYHLLMVEEFIPAELTPEKRQDIINRLFQEWLAGEFNSVVHNK